MKFKEVMKDMSPKEKLEYIWEYYKWHIIILIFLLFMFGNIFYTKLTSKDYVLRGQFMNTITESSEALQLEEAFLEKYPINPKSEQIYFGTSLFYMPGTDYHALEVLTAQIAAGNVDFIMADKATLDKFVYNEYFLDLSEILTEEQMQAYSDNILYYDQAFAEYLDTIDPLSKEEFEIVYPDSTKPELMEKPVPIMLGIDSIEKLYELYPTKDQQYALGFVVTGKNLEKATEFLEYVIN